MKKLLSILFLISFANLTFADPIIDKENCTITIDGETFNLYGKVKIVDDFEDVKAKIVNDFEDIKIKVVNDFENNCCRFKVVNDFEDIKIKIVNDFEDIKVKVVNDFEGF